MRTFTFEVNPPGRFVAQPVFPLDGLAFAGPPQSSDRRDNPGDSLHLFMAGPQATFSFR
jgi:hypothetical protein